MKRLLIIAVSGFAVLLLAVIGLFTFLIGNLDGIVKDVIESQGSEVAGVPVTVSGVEITLLDGRAAISALEIGNPDGFKSDNAVSLDGISVQIDTASIGDPVIVIKEISVDAPMVTYELAPGGNNIGVIQSNVQKSVGDGSGGTAEPGESEAASRKLVIDTLNIRGGRVRVAASTGLLGDRQIEGRLPDITLRDIGKDQGGATPEQVAEKVIAALTAAARQSAANLGVGKSLEGLKQQLDALSQGKLPANEDEAKKAIEDVGSELNKAGEGLKKLFGN